jgi:hypothetical protein
VRPVFQSVLDLGLRDVGVRNEPRRLAAHFGKRSVPLLALAVIFAVVPCAILRQLGADGSVLVAFVLTWTAVVLALILRTVKRAPVAVVRVTAEGLSPLAWLVMAPFALLVLMALLTRQALLLPAVALHVTMVVALWRGRRRVPDLLRTLCSWLAWDETVLGDGLGVVSGARGQGSLRLVVATDRRLLVAAPAASLPALDLRYADISGFGIEWTHRGRLGRLSLVAGEETVAVRTMAPANLLSIARALQAQGVAADDPALVPEAERAWAEALGRAASQPRLVSRAGMRTREFDQGLWLLLALCAVVFYVNPFGIGLGSARDAVPMLMAVPVLGAISGYVSGTRSSIAYLVPLNLLVAPAFFFADAGVVLGLMVVVSALATVGLWIGSALRQAPAGVEPRAARGTLRDAVSGAGLVRISDVLLAAIVGLVAATAAAGFELPDLRLAVEEATAKQLPVDGRSNVTGGAASLTYTPGPGLHELVTDEAPLSGPYDGARWELRSSFTKGYNVITLGHYIVTPPLDGPEAVAAFLAEKDGAHSRLAGRPVTHTERVVDGRRGYVWDHGSPRGFWYYAAWFPEPVHSVRFECIARRQTGRFKRLCAEAIGSLRFH